MFFYLFTVWSSEQFFWDVIQFTFYFISEYLCGRAKLKTNFCVCSIINFVSATHDESILISFCTLRTVLFDCCSMNLHKNDPCFSELLSPVRPNYPPSPLRIDWLTRNTHCDSPPTVRSALRLLRTCPPN